MSTMTRDTQGGQALDEGMLYGPQHDLAPVTAGTAVGFTVAGDATIVEFSFNCIIRFTITAAGVAPNPATATHGHLLPANWTIRYGVRPGDVLSISCVTTSAGNAGSVLEGASS